MLPKRIFLQLSRYRFHYLSILPALILIFIISFYPLVYAVYLSFFEGSLARLIFSGFDNYIAVLKDEFFFESLKNSLIYTGSTVVLTLSAGLGIGLLMSQPGKIVKAFKYIAILPWIISHVAAGVIWKWILNAEFGIVNEILLSIGFSRVYWLSRPESAMIMIMLAGIWTLLPFSALISYTSIISLPKEIFESAQIDGTNSSQKFFRLTLPLLKPASLVLMVVLTIYFFNFITLMMTMTRGGPSRSTTVLPLYMWQLAFEYLRFGYGSVVAIFLFLVNVGLALGYLKIIKTEQLY